MKRSPLSGMLGVLDPEVRTGTCPAILRMIVLVLLLALRKDFRDWHL